MPIIDQKSVKRRGVAPPATYILSLSLKTLKSTQATGPLTAQYFGVGPFIIAIILFKQFNTKP